MGDSPSTRQPLTRYECSHAEETLGLWIAPDSNQLAQTRALQAKLALWADRIRTRQLPPSLAWLSISSGISMALRYPLAATNLSKADCRKITQPLLDVALPAMGLPRRMPHAVVFAPKEFLGYGVFDVWVQQGIDQISVCLDYGPRTADDITGNLLRDVSESLRIELGLPMSPLSYDFQKWNRCTTRTKFHVMWQFCSESGLQLQDGLPDTPILRVSDQFLMSIFESHKCTPKELEILNRCRLFLQVELLSDICTGDGSSLRSDILTLRNPPAHRSTRIWPRSGRPNASCWKFWRDSLIRCLLPIHSRSTRLSQPLGQWMGMPAGWHWFHSASANHLYKIRSDGRYDTYAQGTAGHATRRASFRRTTITVSVMPLDALPTTSFPIRGSFQHTGTSSVLPPKATESPWQGSVVSYPASFPDLLEGIRTGTAIAVTDGSFKEGMGTAAYTLSPTLLSPSDASYTLVNCTPGCAEDVDAYRAELGGIYGILETANCLCLANQVFHGAMTIACDCLSAIQNISKQYDPSPGTSHHDILSHIRYLIRISPIDWSFRHVRGHQDDHCAYSHLDRWGQRNVDMDTLSKAYWQTLAHSARPPAFHLTPFPGQWSIWQGLYRFPSWTVPRATQVYHQSKVALFWNQRLSQPDALHTFDWSSSALALRRIPTFQRLWTPKWLCSVLPFGKNLQRWGVLDQLVCPRCGEDELHKFHVISCCHVEATAIRLEGLRKLTIFLDEAATSPDLKLGLISLIEAAISKGTWTPPVSDHVMTRQTFQAQAILGSHHVLDGFLSPWWAATQLEHYRYLGRRSTGIQWMSRVIRMIWQIAWDMWMHRRRIKDTIDDCALPGLHAALDAAVTDAYTAQLASPDPTLTRWFSRSPHAIHNESLDWKERWLEMIHSSTPE